MNKERLWQIVADKSRTDKDRRIAAALYAGKTELAERLQNQLKPGTTASDKL